MTFTPKHVVTLVACVCAAAVLAPVGVLAATGTLVNISDPVYGSRKARVSAANALTVDSRAGVPTGAFSFVRNDVTEIAFPKVAEVGAGQRIAVTEITVSSTGPDNGVPTVVRVSAWTRRSGTSACGGAGWTEKVLRKVAVQIGRTEQLVFTGPPLLLPTPASGQRVCLTAGVEGMGSAAAHYGVIGYVFS